MENNGSTDFLNSNSLEVTSGEVEVGKTYPMYGMITEFIQEGPGEVIVQLNFSITAHLFVPTIEHFATLKERAFEPGIFISTVKEMADDGKIVVDCQTVVFGKKQGGEMLN